MPAKRSRVGRSSSFDDASFLNQISIDSLEHRRDKRIATVATGVSPKGVSNSTKTLKPLEVARDYESRPKILAMLPPEVDKGRIDVGFEGLMGGFLQKCYYCNKKIGENVDVFMYGCLRAFCTSECRNEQIILEKALEKMSGEPIDTMNEDPKVDNAKNQFGFEKGKKAAP